MNVLLSTAYWPNLQYFFYVLNAEKISIEQFENYQKQSFRNRTQILSANGKLDLSIPINKKSGKEEIKNIRISYKDPWQAKHWKAITSAYRQSPFFDFFEDDLKEFYTSESEFLIDYNCKQLRLILHLLKQKREIKLTPAYEKFINGYSDLREKIHPKIEPQNDDAARVLQRQYYQTFGDKYGFVPNLSILDLLCNKGLDAAACLKN